MIGSGGVSYNKEIVMAPRKTLNHDICMKKDEVNRRLFNNHDNLSGSSSAETVDVSESCDSG